MIKHTIIKQIDDSDLDDLVQKVYGKPYTFQQQNGCQERGARNITVPERILEDEVFNTISEAIEDDAYGVSFEDWLAADPNNPIFGEEEWEREMMFHRNVYPPIEQVVNDLHAKGLIDAGEYQILIDW
jgi:hypothetical protein